MSVSLAAQTREDEVSINRVVDVHDSRLAGYLDWTWKNQMVVGRREFVAW